MISSEITLDGSEVRANRFFELAVSLAVEHENFVDLVAAPIEAGFQLFFSKSDDMLFQLAMMDLIVQLGTKPHSSILLSKADFLQKMLR